ncbi:hypothetical protein Lalb_Chr14g0361691 [Lupinus albus]|uniref:Uncharacterized protein n=1 Tax=Lupinus albus TaxID=3870 RepID=A0A6A4PD18_LUPAL|nr:hypothetical protein Lalb_Chr14g0361691 [Lupinus albus]
MLCQIYHVTYMKLLQIAFLHAKLPIFIGLANKYLLYDMTTTLPTLLPLLLKNEFSIHSIGRHLLVKGNGDIVF